MRGVTGAKHAPVLHGFGEKAAHRCDVLLRDLAPLKRPARRAEAGVELVLDAVVRPLVEVLVCRALEIEPADRVRTHAEQGETAFVMGEQRDLLGRRRVRANPQPAERLD